MFATNPSSHSRKGVRGTTLQVSHLGKSPQKSLVFSFSAWGQGTNSSAGTFLETGALRSVRLAAGHGGRNVAAG